MKALILNSILTLTSIVILSACRQIFGDGTQPESIVEVPNEPSQIVIMNPVYGSIWKPCDVLKIKWLANSIRSVDIQLFKKSSFQFTIMENVENIGSFEWLIPSDINLSNHYLLKIINHNNPNVYQFSSRFGIQD